MLRLPLFSSRLCRATVVAGIPATPAGRATPLLPGQDPHAGNPMIPGHFADPSIVEDGGKHYIFTTMDPWGGETLGYWESADFKTWTFRDLNRPTNAACTRPDCAGHPRCH